MQAKQRHLLLWLATIICLQAVARSSTIQGLAPVLTDHDMGIWQRTFTGTFDGAAHNVHLWLRCRHVATHIILRGLLVTEPVHARIHQEWAFLDGPERWDPQITVSFNQTSHHNLTHTFPGDARSSTFLPSHLTATISNVTPVRGSWEVTIEGMDGIHVFDAQLCSSAPHVKAPSTVIALRPFLSSDLETAATLLVHHILYHRCMGVQLHHLYVEPGQALILLQNRQLAHLHRLQHIVFFEWPMRLFTGSVGADRYGHKIQVQMQYWQIVINNHVLLAYWGTHAKIVIIDIDEFLLGPVFQAVEQVACVRHMYMTCHDCQPSSSEFAQAWKGSTTSQALHHYRVDGYWKDWDNHGKCWTSAEAEVIYGVHQPFLGGVDVYRHSIASAGLMHFTNMWSDRQRALDSIYANLTVDSYFDEAFGKCLGKVIPSPHHKFS